MRLRRVVPLVLLLVVVALVTAGCSGDDGDDAGGSSGDGAPSAPFDGTNWVLTDRSDLGTPLGSVAVTARFTSDTMAGSAGCNTYRAPIARDDPKVEVTGPIATTQMACIGGADGVERAYLAVLPDVRTYAIDGNRLTLRDLDGTTLLVYRAGGVADLVGDWTATSYFAGDAIQSVATGVTVTARFTPETVSGNGGCNQFNGPADIGRDTIRLGPLASTLMGCSEPVATQEQQYLAALELARTYEVKGGRLTLFRQGGTIAATFERT